MWLWLCLCEGDTRGLSVRQIPPTSTSIQKMISQLWSEGPFQPNVGRLVGLIHTEIS